MASIDRFLDRHSILMLFLLLVTLLRIPSLFEPVWYGDEAIYLTVGNALNQGKLLYSQIIDHKTPLIYYVAALAPSITWFKAFLLGWMLLTTTAFLNLANQLFNRSRTLVILSTGLFVLLTSLPTLEGNIVNGELLMMGWILLGASAFTRTRFWYRFKQTKQQATAPYNSVLLLLTGLCWGMAVLSKVPSAFDILGLGSVIWWVWLDQLREGIKTKRLNWPVLKKLITDELLLFMAVLLPIVVSVGYFALRGTVQEYLQFGLLYNLYYVGTWVPELVNAEFSWYLSIIGKAALLMTWLIGLSLTSRWLSKPLLLTSFWTIAALVAATLSNRPYPHYFLQVVPPASLLVAAMMQGSKHPKKQTSIRNLFQLLATGWIQFKNYLQTGWSFQNVIIGSATLATVGVVFYQLQVIPYSTTEYYQRFSQLLTNQLTYAEYAQQFNQLVLDNARLSYLLRLKGVEEIFIWGTNPLLYAQSSTSPVGLFTVDFHIDDLAYRAQTIDHLEANPPNYIVVTTTASEFSELSQLLTQSYLPVQQLDTQTLWKKM